jgi:nicotinamidase-related amidase
MSDSAAWIRKYMVGLNTDDPNDITEGSLEGSERHDVINEIKPLERDLRIIKYRSSAFFGTPLDARAQTTIITGVVTDGCVESTARDASNQYFVVIPEDCVWSGNQELHEASLVVMKHRYDIVRSEDIMNIWEKDP